MRLIGNSIKYIILLFSLIHPLQKGSKPMSYKFLLFDLDHTLLDFDLAEDVALRLLLEDAGVEDIKAYQDYYIPMNKALWEDLALGKISKDDLISSRFAKLFAHFGQEVDGNLFAAKYQEFLSQQGQVYAGAKELLEQLKKSDYRMLAATNGVTYIQKGRLAQSGISSFFEKIFISDEMGYHKPEKEFYDFIEKAVDGFEPSQALMIGDSLMADILGGNNAGIDTAWYNTKKSSNTSFAKPTYTISNYQELMHILQSS